MGIFKVEILRRVKKGKCTSQQISSNRQNKRYHEIEWVHAASCQSILGCLVAVLQWYASLCGPELPAPPPPPKRTGCLIWEGLHTLHIPTNKKLEVWIQYRLLLSFLRDYFEAKRFVKINLEIRKNPEKSTASIALVLVPLKNVSIAIMIL